MTTRQKCAGRKAACTLFEGQCPKPAYFFKNYAGSDLHTFGINYAGFPQKYAEKPAYFLRVNVPRGLGIIGFSGCLHTFARFLYLFIILKKKKKSNNI
jgi:hypothetical protein